MVCSLIHFCFLRFVEPLCERGELAVALLAEVCDAGVFVCGLILILGQSANDKFRYAVILECIHVAPKEGMLSVVSDV